MKDIARMVGVSESTVSRAINGQPGVGQKTKEKILALVEKYQYQPNSLAKGLATKETHTLGLLLPDITDLHQTQVVQGIEERANQLGYRLILANTGGCHQKEISYLHMFQQNRVDGIIFVGGSLAEEEILRLGLNKYPLVLVNKLVEELALPSLFIDHQAGVEQVVQYFHELGQERIGMVIGSLDHLVNQQIYQGYQRAIEEEGLTFSRELLIEGDDSYSGGYQGFLHLLELDSPPTAIFAVGDLIAAGVVEAIKLGGYLIPGEIKVIGYGKTQLTEIIHPLLTTIHLPWRELGVGAVNQLLKVMQKEEISEPFVVLQPQLIPGDST